MGNSENIRVDHNTEKEQFEIRLDGKLAFLTYSQSDGRLFLLHAEVPEAFEGRGCGGLLVRTAMDYAREEGLRVVPFCPFASTYLKRHPEYGELVEQR